MKFEISKIALITFAVLLVSVFAFSAPVASDLSLEKNTPVLSGHVSTGLETKQESISVSVIDSNVIDYDLLKEYEPDNYEKFNRIEIGNLIVYWYQRMVGDAYVEKNQIVYQFDKDTKKLVKKIVRWRDDLPEQLPPLLITKEWAEFMAKGEIQFSNM
ncbi:MAG: hypothetical protein KJ613_04805, partial [Nanoarchaeota archaeon]|nr:hypothetical protein [Nanoarchaeota archaeon]